MCMSDFKMEFLTREEERDLAAKGLAGDAEARNRVVMNCFRMIRKLAWMHKGRVPFEDLVQHGICACLEKFHLLDLSMNNRPLTYFYWVAKRQMEVMTKTDGVIKRPRELSDLHDPKTVLKAQRAGKALSADMPIRGKKDNQGNNKTLGDTIPDHRSKAPHEEAANNELGEILERHFRWLDERSAEIIRLRHGQNLTLEEVGRIFGITKERVRQLENKALARLQDVAMLEEKEQRERAKSTAMAAPVPVVSAPLTAGAAPIVADEEKDPIAVELGRRGGLKGGRARAEAMSPEERTDAASKAAKARWEPRPCAVCEKLFRPKKKNTECCSPACAAIRGHQSQNFEKPPIGNFGECAHCRRVLTIFKRGLCGKCYRNEEIKNQHPPRKPGAKRLYLRLPCWYCDREFQQKSPDQECCSRACAARKISLEKNPDNPYFTRKIHRTETVAEAAAQAATVAQSTPVIETPSLSRLDSIKDTYQKRMEAIQKIRDILAEFPGLEAELFGAQDLAAEAG